MSGGTHPLEAGLWRRARRHHQTPCVWLAARSRGFWRQRQCNRRCPPLYPVQDTCDGEARGITFASADPAWGRSTATRPCQETHRGLVGTPALADRLWPVADSREFVAVGRKRSHALFPSLLARSRRWTPRDHDVENRRTAHGPFASRPGRTRGDDPTSVDGVLCGPSSRSVVRRVRHDRKAVQSRRVDGIEGPVVGGRFEGRGGFDVGTCGSVRRCHGNLTELRPSVNPAVI